MHIHICLRVCIWRQMIHTSTYVYIYTHIETCTYIIYTYLRRNIYNTYTYIYTYMHICQYIYTLHSSTNVPAPLLLQLWGRPLQGTPYEHRIDRASDKSAPGTLATPHTTQCVCVCVCMCVFACVCLVVGLCVCV